MPEDTQNYIFILASSYEVSEIVEYFATRHTDDATLLNHVKLRAWLLPCQVFYLFWENLVMLLSVNSNLKYVFHISNIFLYSLLYPKDAKEHLKKV